MSAIQHPSLNRLVHLRDRYCPADTADVKTFKFIYFTPLHPLPFIQPITVEVESYLPLPVGRGGWTIALFDALKKSVYIPGGYINRIEHLQIISPGQAADLMVVVTLERQPSLLPPICNDINTCKRGLTNIICPTRTVTYVVTPSGDPRNPTTAEAWMLWNWFRRSVACQD
ncbi:hypothetical protein GYMLUDRAFT_245712 [Collybiopsis luxurians FD-317 M1]|uniref:Uncharacterized protein n=1 Tax=Collybiopsis luxurians FD-317 M1 TaxID=944289 RepID=A0A0D0B6B3_9AGAR|nr:hypothetical protein GYMLUDRAFT_245712 [Collybiopsis luxurians FD-317 M1]